MLFKEWLQPVQLLAKNFSAKNISLFESFENNSSFSKIHVYVYIPVVVTSVRVVTWQYKLRNT